jgi:MATE family multidrug resistance protein
MYFSLLGLALLVPIGTLLMYGLGWGAFGAAVATVSVCWLQTGAFLAFLRGNPRYRDLGWEHGPRGPDFSAIWSLLRLGVPMSITVMLEIGLFSAAALLIGRFGSAAVASHQIALNVASVTFMVPLGIAMAITTRVGHAAGRGDNVAAQRAGLVGIILAICAQALACVVLLAVPQAIARLYTDDVAVQSAAAGLLFLAALFQLSDGLQVASAGALRGLKDARMPMVITLFAYWVVGMPLGWLLAFPLGLRTPGMWVGLIAGLSCAAILLFSRFLVLSRRRVRVLAL